MLWIVRGNAHSPVIEPAKREGSGDTRDVRMAATNTWRACVARGEYDKIGSVKRHARVLPRPAAGNPRGQRRSGPRARGDTVFEEKTVRKTKPRRMETSVRKGKCCSRIQPLCALEVGGRILPTRNVEVLFFGAIAKLGQKFPKRSLPG